LHNVLIWFHLVARGSSTFFINIIREVQHILNFLLLEMSSTSAFTLLPSRVVIGIGGVRQLVWIGWQKLLHTWLIDLGTVVVALFYDLLTLLLGHHCLSWQLLGCPTSFDSLALDSR
jgi:hypothetical protein